MPGARHVVDTTSPKPLAARSASVASNLAWYSAVRGACCPRPGGLVGSNEGSPSSPGTTALAHCPFRSGYLASSNAQLSPCGMHIAAASTIIPTEPRYFIDAPHTTAVVPRRVLSFDDRMPAS